ncbi:MAG: sensor domain-containing protein [Chloroflexi bacterium]|nr:sensor domain-containing protein [Chloroflexota bacterium]
MNGTNETAKRGVFGVVIDPQSYLNIAYLLLALPLGTAYFTFLVTGLSVGFGMIITLAGIPILLLVLGGSSILTKFERWSAREMLKQEIVQSTWEPIAGGWWARLKAHLSNRITWTGMLYLLLKFPAGIVTFTIVVTLVSVTIGFLAAPAYTWASDSVTWGDWEFDPFTWSWIPTLIGIPMIFISLHMINGVASLSGKMTRVMLGKV